MRSSPSRTSPTRHRCPALEISSGSGAFSPGWEWYSAWCRGRSAERRRKTKMPDSSIRSEAAKGAPSTPDAGPSVLRIYAIYTAAAAIGIFAPVFVLWAARTAPLGASPVVVVGSVVLALAFTSALLASFLPRRWIVITSLVSLPIALLGSAMFLALTESGATYYVWLVVGIGSLVSSAIAAFFSAKVVLRLKESDPAPESGRPSGAAQREP